MEELRQLVDILQVVLVLVMVPLLLLLLLMLLLLLLLQESERRIVLIGHGLGGHLAWSVSVEYREILILQALCREVSGGCLQVCLHLDPPPHGRLSFSPELSSLILLFSSYTLKECNAQAETKKD